MYLLLKNKIRERERNPPPVHLILVIPSSSLILFAKYILAITVPVVATSLDFSLSQTTWSQVNCCAVPDSEYPLCGGGGVVVEGGGGEVEMEVGVGGVEVEGGGGVRGTGGEVRGIVGLEGLWG